MKNILIPSDFSENSWNAVEYALSFFKKVRCNFYILNVSRLPSYINGGIPYEAPADIVENTVLKEAKTEMKKVMKRIEKLPYNTRHNFVSLIDYNFLVDAVKKNIEEKNIDLVVMGTKGASGLKEKILGSNTGDVITRVQHPEFVIPEQAKYSSLKEIAFPTDFNLLYNAKMLDTLLEMADFYNASIRVLYVAKKSEKLNKEQLANKELLAEYLKEYAHSFHQVTNEKLEQAIQCFVESRNIDMIAMVGKNLNFFQQMFFRPTIKNISYHTEVPFLVLHE